MTSFGRARDGALAIAALTLGACAGNGTGDPAPTRTFTASATSTVSQTATHTETPTSTSTVTNTVTASATATPPATPTASPIPLCDVPGTVCTVVGTGKSLFDGDGRDALLTSLYFPYDVAFDGEGRALVLDWNNLRLRRVNADNTVETIVGSDFEAAPEEGALAVDTPLHHASDVELDAAGGMYFADYHVPLVFRVGTDERVRFVAGNSAEVGSNGDGGPALDALLTTPFGVFPSPDGGVYLSDIDAHVIRHVNAAGIIEAIAGRSEQPGYSGDGGPATEASLNGPARLRLDRDGNLIFCDSNNHVVRRIDRAGIITTIAGTGTQGYAGDGGPATAAQLDSPHDLRIDDDGTLYIADTGNNVIRRVDAGGAITTIAGDGEAGYGGDGGDAQQCRFDRPTGIEFAPDGSLWVADTLNNRVRRIAGVIRR